MAPSWFRVSLSLGFGVAFCSLGFRAQLGLKSAKPVWPPFWLGLQVDLFSLSGWPLGMLGLEVGSASKSSCPRIGLFSVSISSWLRVCFGSFGIC